MKIINSNIAIQLINVSKKYEIHHEKPTFVEKIVNGETRSFVALNTVNLTIHKGEKIGIIGPNGSGKTTILKIIAGITSPTTGTVKTFGKVISLIDLEAGFHDDLTGEQNIYLNGMILGMKKGEIKSKIKRIIQFADIGQFIDAPLFTHSQGMKLRLGFSIVAYADPDILIIDEGLSTGDIKFQKKSIQKIQEFFHLGKTIIVVSHWLEFIQKNTNRILYIKNGRILEDGFKHVIDIYKKSA